MAGKWWGPELSYSSFPKATALALNYSTVMGLLHSTYVSLTAPRTFSSVAVTWVTIVLYSWAVCWHSSSLCWLLPHLLSTPCGAHYQALAREERSLSRFLDRGAYGKIGESVAGLLSSPSLSRRMLEHSLPGHTHDRMTLWWVKGESRLLRRMTEVCSL